MPEFTLSIQRYDPDAGQAAYWEDFEVDLPETRSVLDGILEARDFQDGSLAIRCSCQAAICGSCGVRINGQPALACNTKLGVAQSQSERARGTGDAAPLAVADRGSGGDGHEGSRPAAGGAPRGETRAHNQRAPA